MCVHLYADILKCDTSQILLQFHPHCKTNKPNIFELPATALTDMCLTLCPVKAKTCPRTCFLNS